MKDCCKIRAPDKRGIEDNAKIIFLFLNEKMYVVTPHENHLNETVLMRGHKIHFYGEIWLIIPKLSQLPLLIRSAEKKNHKLDNILSALDRKW